MSNSSFGFVPFSQLPDSRRREMRTALTDVIENTTPGKKYINAHIKEDSRPNELDQWSQIYFPGLDSRTIFNMYIYCSSKVFWERVGQQVDLEYPRHKPELILNPGNFGEYIRERQIAMDTADIRWGGKTRRDAIEDLSQNIITFRPPSVHESFFLDKSFEYGIGVYAVAGEPYITDSAIEMAIDRFREHEEKDWCNSRAIDRNLLPRVTESKYLEKFAEYLRGPNQSVIYWTSMLEQDMIQTLQI